LQSAFQFLFLKNMASLSIMLMVIVKETELVRIFCVWKSWSSYSGRLVILPCLGVSSIMINIFYEAKDNELVFFILFSQTTPLIKSRTNSIQNMGFLWLHDELEFWVEILCLSRKHH
jgi:hypothetical protein